jgi:hypothetical protein
VQAVLELGRDRTDRRCVGAVQREHRTEQRDHARSSRAADALDHLAADVTRQPAGRAGEGPDEAR